MPDKVRQTVVKRQSGRLFGKASGIGTAFRYRLIQMAERKRPESSDGGGPFTLY